MITYLITQIKMSFTEKKKLSETHFYFLMSTQCKIEPCLIKDEM